MKAFRTRLKAVIAGTCLIAAASPAFADTTDDLLLTLKNKGILTDAEYEQLLQRKATEPATTAAATTDTGTVTAAAPPAANRSPQAAQAQASAAGALDLGHLVRTTDKGVGMQIGDVAITFSGSVNGYYVHDSGDKPTANHVVSGGLASVGSKSSAVRNGLLPGYLKIDVTTQQAGWDVGAHFGLYPGIDSVTGVGGANSTGSPTALSTSGIDFRQTYLTFGKPKLGEFKIGRDIGLFGSEGILNDITLLSVGSPGANAAPSNTSLGRIGLGYIYTDFQPQITYTSPNIHGFQATVGAFQPLQTAGRNETNKNPGFQGKIVYDWKGDTLGVRVWLSGITQKHDASDLLPSYTGNAFDVGSKLRFGPATLTGYYYDGKGVGTTGLFILSTDSLGNRRDTYGYYVQGTYTIGKLSVGVSYGASYLKLTGAEKADRLEAGINGVYDPTLLDHNSSWVGGARYGLTSWVTLISEYAHTHSVAHGGNAASSDAVAGGAILFF